MKIFYQLVIIVLSSLNYSATKSCLHSGCEMTDGLNVNDLEDLISGAVEDTSFVDNVLKIATWNVFSSNTTNEIQLGQICKYLNKLLPTILSLQDIRLPELRRLESCLTTYISIGVSSRTILDQNTRYNVIFYKNERRLKLLDSGSFMLSGTPSAPGSKLPAAQYPSTCVWAKFSFAARKTNTLSNYVTRNTPTLSFAGKLLHLLKIFTNKISWSKMELESNDDYPEAAYQWSDFFVATTKLDSNDIKLATDQSIVLKLYLRNYITERRRYAIILTGDFGFEEETPVYESLDSTFWLNNTMANSKLTFPALTSFRNLRRDGKLTDYIWQNKFNSILAGTLTDFTSLEHKPVVAALLNFL